MTRLATSLATSVLRTLAPLLLLLGASQAHAQSVIGDGAALLLDQILDCQDAGIFTDAQNVSLNRYGGSWTSKTNPSFIRFADYGNGVLPANNTKCSSLVTHLLKNLHGWNWKDFTYYDPVLQVNRSTASPEAYQYVALIKQQKGLVEIPTLDQARAGDILAWWEVGKSSGDHTMLISSIHWESAKPYPLGYANSNPALAGTTYYEVTVVDSSSDTHSDDTRLVDINGVETHIAGIGRGIIGILVNENLEIIGRTWSLPTSDYTTQTNTWVGSLNNRLKLAPTWEFAIGRVPELP